MNKKMQTKIVVDVLFIFNFLVIPFCKVFCYERFIDVTLFGYDLSEEGESFPLKIEINEDDTDCKNNILFSDCSTIDQ